MRKLDNARIVLVTISLLFCIVELRAQTFDPTNIISDQGFTDANTMTIKQVQAFLDSRNGGLKDPNLWRTYNFSYPTEPYFYNYLLANGKLGKDSSPAEIIYYSAIDPSSSPNQVNPKVMIAMLQKEQSLIDNPARTTQATLDIAAGYDPGNSKYKGFFNQVISMAFDFTKDFNALQPGVQPAIQVNSAGNIVTITPQNRATAVLYEYNPSIDGNRNFWQIYNNYSGTATFLLNFPSPGFTAYSAPISSVFDHSMQTSYSKDGVVVAFSGETGNVNGINDCYKQANGNAFTVNGNYQGISSLGPTYLCYDGHPGIDYKFSSGTSVLAAADGVVSIAQDIYLDNTGSGLGNYIKIDHGNGYSTIYAHLQHNSFQVNTTTQKNVTRGQIIARSDNTGSSSGAHLHFEVLKDGVPVDPYGWQGSGTDPYTQGSNINLWQGSGVNIGISQNVSVTATRSTPSIIYALPDEYGNNPPVEDEKNFKVNFKLQNTGSSPITLEDYGVSVRDANNNHLFRIPAGSGINLSANEETPLFEMRGYITDDRLVNSAATSFKAQVQIKMNGNWQDLTGSGSFASFTVNPRPPISNGMLVKRPRSAISSEAMVYFHQNGRKWEGTATAFDALFPGWQMEFYVYPTASVNALSTPATPNKNPSIPKITGRNLLYKLNTQVTVYIIEPEPPGGSLKSRPFADQPAFYSYGYAQSVLNQEIISFNSSQLSWLQNQYPLGSQITSNNTTTKTIDVYPGWNMLALPLEVQNNALSAIFPTAQFAWGYNPGNSSQPWYNPNSLQFGTGYWLWLPSGTTVSITGTPNNNVTLSLKSGWNLLGGISTNIALNEITQIPSNSIYQLIYHWNAQQGGYDNPTTLQPAKAYWVYAWNDCQLTMDKSSGSAKVGTLSLSFADELKGFNAIKIEDNQKYSMKLYFSKYPGQPGDEDQFMLPPKGPRDTFDARFSNNRFVSILNEGESEHHIEIQSERYPVILTWQGLDLTKSHFIITDPFDGAILGDHEMETNGSFIITDPRINRLIIRGIRFQASTIPTKFELAQNYPNPFNPETSIAFKVATEKRVQIVVYDIIGQEVRRLIDRVMSPGEHNVFWDGRSEKGAVMPSGIYFYKMSADGFTRVRKMLIVR